MRRREAELFGVRERKKEKKKKKIKGVVCASGGCFALWLWLCLEFVGFAKRWLPPMSQPQQQRNKGAFVRGGELCVNAFGDRSEPNQFTKPHKVQAKAKLLMFVPLFTHKVANGGEY